MTRLPRSAAGLEGLALAAVVLGAAYWVWRKGGLTAAASSIGAGVVSAVGGATSGAVGAVGAAVGLPTPDETTTDPRVARWIIDQAGYFTASKWAGVPALLEAVTLPAGSGTPPPAGSAAARALLPASTSTASAPWPGLVAIPPGASWSDLANGNPADYFKVTP